MFTTGREGSFARLPSSLLVIFNAFDPVIVLPTTGGRSLPDRHHVHGSEIGRRRAALYDWHLGILRDQVFGLAIRTVAGSRDPRWLCVSRRQPLAASRASGGVGCGRRARGGGGRERTDARRKCPRSAPFPTSPQRRAPRTASIIRPCRFLLRSVGLVAPLRASWIRRDRTPASSKSLCLLELSCMDGGFRRREMAGHGRRLSRPGPPRRHLLEL